MTQAEKAICDDILKGGEVVVHDRFTAEGKDIECYKVHYSGEDYTMTKHDGEWVYFHRC